MNKNTTLQCCIFEAFHIFKCRLTERSFVDSLTMYIRILSQILVYRFEYLNHSTCEFLKINFQKGLVYRLEKYVPAGIELKKYLFGSCVVMPHNGCVEVFLGLRNSFSKLEL